MKLGNLSDVDRPRDCCTWWSKSEKEKQISYINACMWNLEKWYWWFYLQDRERDTDIESKPMDTKGGKGWRGGSDWETGVDIYIVSFLTLIMHHSIPCLQHPQAVLPVSLCFHTGSSQEIMPNGVWGYLSLKRRRMNISTNINYNSIVKKLRYSP